MSAREPRKLGLIDDFPRPAEKMSTKQAWLELVKSEYDCLKAEQLKRIGFRDNLVYVVVVALGAVLSLLAKTDEPTPLLVVPWISSILGWTYLVNDQKISAIGRYIRHELHSRIENEFPEIPSGSFGWETAHRSDKRRVSRKWLQLLVDLTTFVLPSVVCLALYASTAGVDGWAVKLLLALETAFILILSYQIVGYADLRRGK